eukprot:4975682-Pyramimonas_sp.AAC.1
MPPPGAYDALAWPAEAPDGDGSVGGFSVKGMHNDQLIVDTIFRFVPVKHLFIIMGGHHRGGLIVPATEAPDGDGSVGGGGEEVAPADGELQRRNPGAVPHHLVQQPPRGELPHSHREVLPACGHHGAAGGEAQRQRLLVVRVGDHLRKIRRGP